MTQSVYLGAAFIISLLNQACKLSVLPLAGWEMSTSQSAVMLYGWGVKADMAHFIYG